MKSIALDGIAFESDGHSRTIEIGENLQGDVAPTVSYYGLVGETAGGPDRAAPVTSASTEAGPQDSISVLERLRQRRERELGR